MEVPVVALPSLDELRRYVRHELCNHDRLDPQQATFREAAIRRGERTCGLFFQVVGAARHKAYAVWAGDEHRVLFYDGAGYRFAETALSESPDPEGV